MYFVFKVGNVVASFLEKMIFNLFHVKQLYLLDNNEFSIYWFDIIADHSDSSDGSAFEFLSLDNFTDRPLFTFWSWFFHLSHFPIGMKWWQPLSISSGVRKENSEKRENFNFWLFSVRSFWKISLFFFGCFWKKIWEKKVEKWKREKINLCYI